MADEDTTALFGANRLTSIRFLFRQGAKALSIWHWAWSYYPIEQQIEDVTIGSLAILGSFVRVPRRTARRLLGWSTYILWLPKP